MVVRVDMNVPFDKRGRVLDDFRIRQCLPTIQWILAHGGTVAVCTHRGSPKRYDTRLSAAPIAKRLSQLLQRNVHFVRNPLKENPRRRMETVLFLENLRFFPGEQKNSPSFAKALARWGELYVNDAFAESHRNVASIVHLPKLLPSYAGLLFVQETFKLKKIFVRPRRPFLVIIGGAKISTKIRYIRSFLSYADGVVLGGALFNTLLAARGGIVGRSAIEKGAFGMAKRLLASRKLILPQDVRVLHRIDGATLDPKRSGDPASRGLAHPLVHSVDDVGANDYICDIGPDSVVKMPKCRMGTIAVARALAVSRARVVVGGGDLEALWRETRIPTKNVYMSTGGGALLDFVMDGNLVGIEALERGKRNHV